MYVILIIAEAKAKDEVEIEGQSGKRCIEGQPVPQNNGKKKCKVKNINQNDDTKEGSHFFSRHIKNQRKKFLKYKFGKKFQKNSAYLPKFTTYKGKFYII